MLVGVGRGFRGNVARNCRRSKGDQVENVSPTPSAVKLCGPSEKTFRANAWGGGAGRNLGDPAPGGTLRHPSPAIVRDFPIQQGSMTDLRAMA